MFRNFLLIPALNMPSSHIPVFAQIVLSSRNALLGFASNSAWKIFYSYFMTVEIVPFWLSQVVTLPLQTRGNIVILLSALIKLHFSLHVCLPYWLSAPSGACVCFSIAAEA